MTIKLTTIHLKAALYFVCVALLLLGGFLYYLHLNTPEQKKERCLNSWYKAHPESEPGNQKPGTIYLSPQCTGVPQ